MKLGVRGSFGQPLLNRILTFIFVFILNAVHSDRLIARDQDEAEVRAAALKSSSLNLLSQKIDGFEAMRNDSTLSERPRRSLWSFLLRPTEKPVTNYEIQLHQIEAAFRLLENRVREGISLSEADKINSEFIRFVELVSHRKDRSGKPSALFPRTSEQKIAVTNVIWAFERLHLQARVRATANNASDFSKLVHARFVHSLHRATSMTNELEADNSKADSLGAHIFLETWKKHAIKQTMVGIQPHDIQQFVTLPTTVASDSYRLHVPKTLLTKLNQQFGFDVLKKLGKYPPLEKELLIQKIYKALPPGYLIAYESINSHDLYFYELDSILPSFSNMGLITVQAKKSGQGKPLQISSFFEEDVATGAMPRNLSALNLIRPETCEVNLSALADAVQGAKAPVAKAVPMPGPAPAATLKIKRNKLKASIP